jgi:hypothetical protein
MKSLSSPWRCLALFCGAGFVLFGGLSSHARPLAWAQRDGYRQAGLQVPPGGKAGFTLLRGEQTGIRWTNRLSMDRVALRQNLMNGAGLAAGDYDGDGLCDLYFCNKEGANALLRNLGNWKFEDMAAAAGVACTNMSSTGAVFADLNGDGHLDLLVNSFTGPNACFLNLGNGRFTNVTESAGLASKGGTTSMALGDVDGDGDLDLYICYFGIEAILRDGGAYSTRMVNGQPVVTGRFAKRLKIVGGAIIELGEPDVLYLNDGNARFTPVAWNTAFRDEDGRPMTPPPDFGLAIQVRDINGDGVPDVYVCNDFQTPDRVWLNTGSVRSIPSDGILRTDPGPQFKAIDRLAIRNMSYASMGVDFGDLDRDGQLDFFTVEMLSRDHARHLRQSSPMSPKLRTAGRFDDREEVARNAFYWNRGDGTYAEIAWFSGLAASDWSWTPICLDVDLDGYEDLLVSNGHLHDVNDRDVAAGQPKSTAQTLAQARALLGRYPRLDTPNAAFRNRGDLTFEDIGDRWGFNSRELSHGMVLADLDNDGDQDVAINCLAAAPLLYRNDASAPRLAVRLKGRRPNLFGIGARMEVSGGPVAAQVQEMLCGARYLSGDDTVRTFAAGSPTNRLTVKVTWRNATHSIFAGLEPNHVYELDQAGAVRTQPPARPVVKPWFEDTSALLAHKHTETDFDDFQRQPLLPRKLSQSGPGVAWCDLDGDGHEDLVLGSGKGAKPGVFRNTGAGRFEPWADAAWDKPASDDQTSIVAAKQGDGVSLLWIGSANYESPEGRGAAATRFTVQGRKVGEESAVPADAASTGPMALADLEGDGSLELFVGGRMIPGRYPEAASSRVFRLSGNTLALDADNSRALEQVGLVSGAVFSDLDGDGLPELILACEWGWLKIFRNERGRLAAWDAPIDWTGPRQTEHETRNTMSRLGGLWQSVTTGDFDGDGRLDIVAGNWGLNTFYNRAPAGPWLLSHGDFNGDGRVQLVEAYLDPGLKKIVPWRDMTLMSAAMPWVRERFASHQAFALASVGDILGDRSAKAIELKVTTLISMIFLNRGGHFEAAPLPTQAQWSPATGLAVADANGDGHEDLFLSQNFFAVRPEDDRLDAGRGLWLRGDGTGRLQAVPGQESGVKMYGEQRGAAVADFDADGRTDLVVTQNGAETRLYRNATARPGLRVKLETAGKADAVGAQLRLIFGDHKGPARELRAGGGYWSQDSVSPVLSTPETPTQLEVRWPGGRTTTSPVPPAARDILVDAEGKVSVRR